MDKVPYIISIAKTAYKKIWALIRSMKFLYLSLDSLELLDTLQKQVLLW